jgi:3-phosphoshikimate 1-carboxyvinyltransferase
VTSFSSGRARSGLRGHLRVPGDKSISHRALLLAARAEGRSRLRGLSTGEDVTHTLDAVRSFGAAVEGKAGNEVLVDGGVARLREPMTVIDVGNSGTGIRLLAGWAATLDGISVLAGDASVAARPMDRVSTPLRLMGARIDGRGDGRFPPLVVRGGQLRGIDYAPPVASAQVKGAVLLAGLGASGETTVREQTPTRLHTEELLQLCGADITWAPGTATVRPSGLRPLDLDVPGDPSQAAFWIVAACVTPGSELTVDNVYVGSGRAGFIDVLRRMGAAVELSNADRETSTASISAAYAPLRATEVGGPEVPSLIDEIPVLAVAAATAEGQTTFGDAAELKVKETDRIATVVAALTAVGARSEGRPDGLVVHGSAGRPLAGGTVDSAGDHRVAMAMAVAGLVAAQPVHVDRWEAVSTSYPTFEEDYHRCVSPCA